MKYLGSAAWTKGAMLSIKHALDHAADGYPVRALIDQHTSALLNAQGVQLPKHVVPAGVRDAFAAYWFAYTFWTGGPITPEQVNFLCAAEVEGGSSFVNMTDMQGHAQDLTPDDYIEMIESNGASLPEDLTLTQEAIDLASAFVDTLVRQTKENYHPFCGDFYLRKPFDLPLIDALTFDHIRLCIVPQGMWLSVITESGAGCPGWWSPKDNNMLATFGTKYMWIFSTLAACIWHDAHTTKDGVKKVASEAARREWRPRDLPRGEKTIRLPRTIYTLSWATNERHVWGNRGIKTDYSVRAHYRRLTAGQQASEQAFTNAMMWAFPDPPDGYTFVSPYSVGAPAATTPRLICKGFQAAKVALSALGKN